jgi:nitric oxide reductase activation protein
MEDGDEVDINAAIDAMIAIRMGEQPNPRITMRNVLNTRDLSVVVLLDLSESTNETMEGSDKTVLQLTREAATLVSTAIEGIGDPFALHGFASDGRHDVQYFRLKDFNQHFDDEAKSRLAGMKGGLSTRMGAALRHAGTHLHKQNEKRKLILLVTDGTSLALHACGCEKVNNLANAVCNWLVFGQNIFNIFRITFGCSAFVNRYPIRAV